MNFCEIKYFDIANGEGIRTVLFVSGCTNHCEGCFQPDTWDFNYGSPFTKEIEDKIIDSLEPYYVNGLTLLGGEPMEPSNQRALLPFVKRIKEKYPNKSIWCFTGFVLEKELLDESSPKHTEITNELLSYIDVLVDGRFVLSKKNISLKFRGSTNQRIIELKETLKTGSTVLWDK